MKKVLIISPYFPPSNAADMQRVRMSLPYFRQFGWDPEVLAVDQVHSHLLKEELLLNSIPSDIKIHYIKAFPLNLTSKLGLGSLALRSIWYLFFTTKQLLKANNYDLIYFSTTQFPVCILGSYWKRRYKVPYVIDIQDPWHTDYYLQKPKSARPPKYWFSYRLNKWLEPIAMKNVGGLISVSDKYLCDLQNRYPKIASIPQRTIPFAVSEIDFGISQSEPLPIVFNEGQISIVYAGVAAPSMQPAIRKLCRALQLLKKQDPLLYSKIAFYFIGTSYAPKQIAKKTITPIAEAYGVAENVFEQTDRIGFYATIKLITSADALLILGTDDPGYTASKLYPYISARKPLLAILHQNSSTVHILNACSAGRVVTLDSSSASSNEIVISYLSDIQKQNYKPTTDWDAFRKYTAQEMTSSQCQLFDCVIP